MSDYAPIACSLHDRLESWAVRRTPVEVVWREDATECVLEAVITDVFAKDGADWIVLEGGPTIRVDRLVRVGGVAMSQAC